MPNKTPVVIIVALIAIVIIAIAAPAVYYYGIRHEAQKVKQEAIQEVKKVDREKLVDGTAKLVHGIKSFKKDVKTQIDSLDSAKTR